MDTEPASGKISPQTPPTPAPSRQAPGAFWTYLLPIVAILLSLALWLQTRLELDELAQGQRQIAADLDAARGLATINVAGAPARGPADQVVTLVEFSDYECPFCIRHFAQTMPQIDEQYVRTGRLRYVFRDFPIDQLHPAAIRGHMATRCAEEQGKFWEMHMRMFSAPGTHGDGQLEAQAAAAGLAVPPFRDCLASGRTMTDVRKTVQLAADLGANGTPAFFVGVRDLATDDVRIVTSISGAQPFAAFEKAIATVVSRIR